MRICVMHVYTYTCDCVCTSCVVGVLLLSDNPRKCNNYSAQTDLRKMFACRVLLGDIKVIN